MHAILGKACGLGVFICLLEFCLVFAFVSVFEDVDTSMWSWIPFFILLVGE